jgi:uncharacterized protein (TIGR02453 family)
LAKKSDRQFTGFPKDCFAFFEELALNNERPWFLANKARYEASVLHPITALVADMAPSLARISPHYVADPRRSVFRIYRDVRFSRDKRPYKEHCAAQFRHAVGRDVHAPGFYVHVAPNEIFMGGGMWMPDAPALKRVREAIVRDTPGWRRAQDKRFREVYGALSDEYSLKRAPKGYDPAHPAIEDIKRTSFVFGRESTRARASKPAFLDEVEEAFSAARPMMRFLCKALDLPF